MAAGLPPLARPNFGLNHVIAYGQSLATGWEGWPALSVKPRHDSLMLGSSVRPQHESAPHFAPIGGPALWPLRATVQDPPTGALLSPEQVAGLPRGHVAMGETVLEGAVNAWRGRMLAEGATRGTRPLLASACGVGGRTLERLVRGAQPELFNRLRDCVTLGRQAAEGFGRSYGIAAFLVLQGEHNNWALDGSTGERGAYRALLEGLYRDMVSELAEGIAGQAVPPALFLYQTGGAYSADAMGVPMAQLAMALEVPGVFMAAPAYPVTDKGGHLDANGYRWLGAQFGKVMHHVLSRNLPWLPLHPLEVRLEGREVRIGFHVPAPPLRFGRPFAGLRQVDVAGQGFSVTDAEGDVGLEAVALSGPAEVTLVLSRAPGPEAMLRYARRTGQAGLGGLHDSDATVAADRYAFDAAAGHYPEADIPGLTGQPYPLMNWCVAFDRALN